METAIITAIVTALFQFTTLFFAYKKFSHDMKLEAEAKATAEAKKDKEYTDTLNSIKSQLVETRTLNKTQNEKISLLEKRADDVHELKSKIGEMSVEIKNLTKSLDTINTYFIDFKDEMLRNEGRRKTQ